MKPLFSSFIFVYTRPEHRPEILQTPGIVNFVYWLDEPVMVTAGEINTIRVILKEYENVRLEKTAVKKDYMGIMAETILLLEKTNVNENAVRIILPSLGYYLVAEHRKASISLSR